MTEGPSLARSSESPGQGRHRAGKRGNRRDMEGVLQNYRNKIAAPDAGEGAETQLASTVGGGGCKMGVRPLWTRVGRSLTKYTLSSPYDPAMCISEFYPAD